jgi:hypothetical protein
VGIAGLINSASAATGTINYQVGSGSVVPMTSEQDFSINVGTISGTVVLRVWDPSLGSVAPDDGVGRITISGSWSAGGELRVLIAGDTCRADFDRSGAVGVPDIFAFLSAWFVGCP